MKNSFSILIFVLAIMIFFSFICYSIAINEPRNKKGDDLTFIVQNGHGIKQIASDLLNQNIIKSKFWFEVYVWQTKNEKKIQAGEYILNSRYSIKKVVEIFVNGDTVNQEKTIKIIPGWNLSDISGYLEKKGMLMQDNFYKIVGLQKIDYRKNENIKYPKPKDYSLEFEFLKDKPKYYGLEGYLFPDTYRVFNNSSIDDIVKKMLINFDKKLTKEMRDEIKKQNKTIYEIITMASIIEKEVRSEEDMETVSGIFWNRIKNGQALESCASLAYILDVNKKQYTFEDTKIDSPYNTYLFFGLPPGPIASPGLQAIKSAIYPKNTEYNFFLSSFDDGKTIFSKTYDEHLKNKVKYLK